MQETKQQHQRPYLLQLLFDTCEQYFMILKRSWMLLFLAAFVGVMGGTGYWAIKHDTYTARTSFVVEDTKSSGGGFASAVAGQLGFDLGSLGSSSGLLEGDNILQLLKSHSLIKKA